MKGHIVRALVTGVAALVAGPVVLVGGGAFVALVAALDAPTGHAASQEALADIPDQLVAVYHQAAERHCADTSWTVLAAIGKVESDHGRSGGAQLGAEGGVAPPIIGPALDGAAGVMAVADTDDGQWDHDPVWDRAVGPMQFIPETWRSVGVDASGSGEADPHNAVDAIHAAARYLCHGEDSSSLRERVYRYNQAGWYVDDVMAIADRYTDLPAATVASGGRQTGGYALPVDQARLTAELLDRAHHDYPAWDLALREGTPVTAVHGGTVASVSQGGRCGRGVVIAGDDGARYTYCHARRVEVATGDRVEAGQHLLDSGNTGHSTGPHLHLDIRTGGRQVCPQPLLTAWANGQAASPSQAPTQGCVS